MRYASGKLPLGIRELWKHINLHPENIVAFTVYDRPVAFMMSHSEFTRYQQWRKSVYRQSPGIRPTSLEHDNVRLEDESTRLRALTPRRKRVLSGYNFHKS